mgnify:CR=1 FL=1
MQRIEKRVIDLYINNKFSAQQIADCLKITNSRVRYVLDKNRIKKRNISEAIRYLNLTKYRKGNFKIKNNLNSQMERLKVAGTMLYWGEGTKFGSSVVLSNSNPHIIRIFLKFLKKICGISKKRLRALLHYYKDQNEKKLKKYWMNIIHIPREQFSKSFLHIHKSGSYSTISKYGTLSLRYSDKRLLGEINKWIEKYRKKL